MSSTEPGSVLLRTASGRDRVPGIGELGENQDMNQHTNRDRRIRHLLLGIGALTATAVGASAQTELLSIEFNEDDQPGFDLWPGGIGGSLISAQFGAITVDVSTNTSFAQPVNRGSMNGTPPGYDFQNLYEDLLHAFTPTGTLTLDFAGLRPDEQYTFTLYAWDPGSPSGTHEWSVTRGTGVPAVLTVDWSTPLTSNDTFALVFDVTTDSNGTFQIDNTAGLAGSAINGFKLRGPGSLGTLYCSPGVVNSSGASASISATGSSAVADNNLTLVASDLPPFSFGLFLTSRMQGLVIQAGGSQGNLCLGGAIGRFVGPGQIMNSGGLGQIELLTDLSRQPTPNGLVNVVSGETWNYQAWHRDSVAGAATSNFTNGLEITFQ